MLTEKQIEEFFLRLEGKEGCNLRQVKGKWIWDCKDVNDKAKEILTKMEIAEKEKIDFLRLCNVYGGNCDCDILFKAKRSIMPEFAQVAGISIDY